MKNGEIRIQNAKFVGKRSTQDEFSNMDGSNTVYLSLGSNLGDKLAMLQEAIFYIEKKVGKVQAVSPVYKSEAWGFDGDDFFNICINVKTDLTPPLLLTALLDIEFSMGRRRMHIDGF